MSCTLFHTITIITRVQMVTIEFAIAKNAAFATAAATTQQKMSVTEKMVTVATILHTYASNQISRKSN